ncbi:MAG: PAS domain S-box protein [Rhodospirillales bacterium]|nr:PAS domain S-box protein [Rhodospirillales bacterium]
MLTINQRIMLLITCLSLGLGGVLSFWVGETLHRQIDEEFNTRAQAITEAYAETSARSIINGDQISVQNSLERVVGKNSDIEHAFATDFNGEIFAHTFKEGLPALLGRMNANQAEAAGSVTHDFTINKGTVRHISFPLIQGMPGRFHIGFNLSFAQARISEIHLQIIGIVLGVVLAGTLIGYWVTCRLTKSLLGLTETVSAYGQGVNPEQLDLEIKGGPPESRALQEAFRDMIEQRKKSETEINDLNQNLASAQRIAHIGSWEWNMISETFNWSDEVFRIFGFRPQEFTPTLGAFLDAVHPDDRTGVRRVIDEALETGEPYRIEHRVVGPDGAVRCVEEQGEVVKDDNGEKVLMRGAVQDVTERKQASAKNERQARIIEESLNEIFVFDAQTLKFTQVNLGARRNLGYSMDELKEMTAYDIKPDFPKDTFIQTIKPLRDGTEERLVFETIHQRKNGSMYDVEVYLQLMHDRGGDAFVAIINDISKRKVTDAEIRDLNVSLEQRVKDRTQALEIEIIERRQTQELLRDSEERTRAIVNSAADGIITINQTGSITSFNGAAVEIFGYEASEAMGKNVSILTPEEHTDKHDGYIASYLETGKAKIIGSGREVEGRRKDGSTFPMELAVSVIEIAGAKSFTGIVRDISARREAEDKLRKTLKELRLTQNELVQSEKMASLGGLVAGVAHEINTPVGIGVTASTHLEETVNNLRGSLADGSMKKSLLESSLESMDQAAKIIATNLRRAADLIGSFKQVAVDQSSEERRSFLVAEYLDEILLSLKPNIKKSNVQVVVDCDPALRIDSYPGAISQTLTNLVMNSLIHAFEDGEKGIIRIAAQADAGEAVIRYTDDGKGMDEAHRKQIFDPFFTTKRGAGGSGLGMHILFNLVTQTLGGTVKCDSAPGEGTSFEITFPAEVLETEKRKASA